MGAGSQQDSGNTAEGGWKVLEESEDRKKCYEVLPARQDMALQEQTQRSTVICTRLSQSFSVMNRIGAHEAPHQLRSYRQLMAAEGLWWYHFSSW